MRGKMIIAFGLSLISHFVLAQPSSSTIIAAASDKYKPASFIKRFVFGSNHREEWGTPVSMPVFDLRKSKFRIKELGGGQQTTSLYLLDENNREWVLRSVDKDYKPPQKFFENTLIEKIIEDHVSASYPYAGLSVTHLSKAAGIVTGESYLYYVPDDTAFGEYRSVMANKVFLLMSYLPDSIPELTTEELLEKLSANKNNTIDQKEFLKVRLLDWLISDWDRHPGQYKWIEKPSAGSTVFQPIARDRDQAFFSSNGLLLKFISMFFKPHMTGFKRSNNDVKRLSRKARKMDKRCTDQLSKEDWINITKEFRTKMSDEVIAAAIRRQPEEIFSIRGNEMIETLKLRRNRLLTNVMEYYSTLNS